MKLAKAALMSVLLSLGIPQARADQTNVVQNLSIQLWGVQPGGSVTNRNVVTTGIGPAVVSNRQIIQALGTATGNSFSPPARLVIVTPYGGGDSLVQVRDGSKQVDVTGFFSHQQLSAVLSGSQSNMKSHGVVSLDYSIQRFALHDVAGLPGLGLHFDMSGFTSETSANRPDGVGDLQIDCAGSGDAGGNLLILHGDVEVRGDRLEVVPSASVQNS